MSAGSNHIEGFGLSGLYHQKVFDWAGLYLQKVSNLGLFESNTVRFELRGRRARNI